MIRLEAPDMLESMAAQYVWPHDRPAHGNVVMGWGIHAFKEADAAVKEYRDYSMYTIAFGSVKLWGEVVEHEHGYRATYGKVRSIDFLVDVGGRPLFGPKAKQPKMSKELKEHRDLLRKAYGV
jgi:hypothetical protein